MLLCVMGPSFPGLSTRTMTTTLIGCCCVAVAVEPAFWLVVDVAVGVAVSAGVVESVSPLSPIWTGCRVVSVGAVASVSPLSPIWTGWRVVGSVCVAVVAGEPAP